jgi:hypothetical protein
MHYLKDGLFEGHIKTDEPETIGVRFARLAGMYQPVEGMSLKTAEIRKLNKAIDVLEAGPADGYYAFEEADFETLKRVLVIFAEISNHARSAPYIEDLLNAVTTELPVSTDSLDPDVPMDPQNGVKPKSREMVA